MSNEQRGGTKPPQQGIQKREATALDVIQSKRAEFARVIPRHLNPDRMLRVSQSAIARDPKLMVCTASSLLRSVMQATTLGLEIGVCGEAYLIPYGKEATFIPGYQGLIKLALQSGTVASINVGAVYPGDVFEWDLGSEAFIRHRPTLAAELPKPNALLATWCVVTLKGGGKQFTVMSKAQIDAIRGRSQARGSGPWVDHYEQMAVKTVVRRAMKYVPKTPELARALEVEDRAEGGEGSDDLFDLPALDVTEESKQAAKGGGVADDTAEMLRKAQGGAPAGGAPGDEWGLDREPVDPRTQGGEG